MGEEREPVEKSLIGKLELYGKFPAAKAVRRER